MCSDVDTEKSNVGFLPKQPPMSTLLCSTNLRPVTGKLKRYSLLSHFGLSIKYDLHS